MDPTIKVPYVAFHNELKHAHVAIPASIITILILIGAAIFLIVWYKLYLQAKL